MALFTVQIAGGVAVEVYGGYDAAVAFMNNRIGAAYTAWRALGADDRKRTLVTATSYLDSLEWVGEANGFDSTELEWPRDDVYRPDGETLVDNAEQLSVVEQATFELAALLAEDASILDSVAAGGGPQIASVSAGGASVSYFEGPTASAEPSTLPVKVDRLLGRWLGGSVVESAVISFGQAGGETSDFAETHDYDRTRPF